MQRALSVRGAHHYHRITSTRQAKSFNSCSTSEPLGFENSGLRETRDRLLMPLEHIRFCGRREAQGEKIIARVGVLHSRADLCEIQRNGVFRTRVQKRHDRTLPSGTADLEETEKRVEHGSPVVR